MPYEDDYKIWLEKMLIESNPDWVCDGMYDVGLTNEWCDKHCGEDSDYVTPKCLHMFYHHIARADRNSSEKPNNCEWSVEYAKEMLDTMPCEECGHWEHGAGDHYYCALLEMRQECYFESKGESTLMFANKPKDEPTISKMEQVEDETRLTAKCLNCANGSSYKCSKCDGEMYYKYDKDEPQTERSK